MTQNIVFQDSNAVFNQEVHDSILGEEVLLGWCTERGLDSSSLFSSFYQYEYQNYPLDSLSLDSLSSTSDCYFLIVMGSWCSDSQREVPRFLKIMHYLNTEARQIKIIGVDRKKQAPIEGLEALSINFVPTIIVYQNGQESGRIIESPTLSLEKDLLNLMGRKK